MTHEPGFYWIRSAGSQKWEQIASLDDKGELRFVGHEDEEPLSDKWELGPRIMSPGEAVEQLKAEIVEALNGVELEPPDNIHLRDLRGLIWASIGEGYLDDGRNDDSAEPRPLTEIPDKLAEAVIEVLRRRGMVP